MPSNTDGNRRRLRHRNRQTRHHHGACFGSAVARQNDGHFVALRDQRLRQRLDHVRKAAGLRERQPFRCYKKNSHALLSTRFLETLIVSLLVRRIPRKNGSKDPPLQRTMSRRTFILRYRTAIPAVKTERARQEFANARFLLHFRRMARQRLGQHFLADADWREQIARAIGVSPHSTLRSPSVDSALAKEQVYCWIEVGAGHGEMTEHLASTGAPVFAIELDELLTARLLRLAKKFPNLTVVHGDVLETDLAALAGGRRIRLYGNLPYYITSPILHQFFTFADLIDEIHIVIQEEVALRLAAKPKTRQYGYLSVVTQLYTRPEFVMRIPRNAFSPPPEVGSALVTLRLPGDRAKLALPTKGLFWIL